MLPSGKVSLTARTMCPQSGKDPFMRHRSSTFGMETGNDSIHDPWWTLFWHVWNWKYVKSLKPEQYRQKTIRLLFNQKWWVASKEQHQLLCEHKPKHFQVLQGWEWHRHTCPRHDIVPGRSYATLDLTLASLWTLSDPITRKASPGNGWFPTSKTSTVFSNRGLSDISFL